MTTPISTSPETVRPREKYFYFLALAIAATMSLIINIAPIIDRDFGSKGELYLSLFDILAPVGLIALIILERRRFIETVRKLPIALAAYLVLAALSVIAAVKLSDDGLRAVIVPFGKKAVMNIGLFLVIGPLFWAMIVRSRRQFETIALVALAAAGGLVLPAISQYFSLQPAPAVDVGVVERAFPFDVGGAFDNWNRLGLILASVLPFAFAGAILFVRPSESDAKPCAKRNLAIRVALGLFVVIGFSMLLKGGALIGAFIGAGLVAGLADGRRNALSGAALLIGALLISGIAMPRRNLVVAIDSLATMKRHPSQTDPYGNAIYIPGERARRLMRVADAVGRRPLTGYGVGQYDAHIIKRSTDYDPDSAFYKGSRQTHDRRWWGIETNEKNDFGLYETVAVETGLPGVICIALLFIGLIARGVRMLASASETDRWLLIGAIASIASIAVASVYLDPLTRGVGPWLSLAIGIIISAPGNETREAANF
jgi:hypothetical protein